MSGYNPNLTIQSSKVNNKYYQGDEYSVKYEGFCVTITNKTKKYTKSFNIYNYVAGINEKDKVDFLKKIQTLPAEVLEDLSVEIDRLNSATGQNMHTKPNKDFVAGGYYSPQNDNITTKPQHIVHELGHAIDYNSKTKSRAANNKVFKATFDAEMKEYIKSGHVRYDYNNKKTWKNDKLTHKMQMTNYCTANEREMFAEIYAMCMTGGCQSANTIVRYFPKTLAIGRQLLMQDRNCPNLQRHEGLQNKIANIFQ